jgi:Fe-S oxidoreductase
VIVPRAGACCGRPLYDFGLLDDARAYLENVLSALAPHLKAELPIVVLEPSCASVFRDEAHNLMPARDDVAVLKKRTMLLGELLMKEAKHFTVPKLDAKAVVQGHCHHKSVLDIGSEQKTLKEMGLDFELLSSGCCGMAGSFGFVEGTRDVGVAAGERVLLPRVRGEADGTLVIANGFSCREQIEQHTPRRALHLAEVIKLALDGGSREGSHPETAIVERREREVRRSMVRAAIGIGIGAVVAVGALATVRAIGRRSAW